jgi:hypothetical protein
LEDFVAKSKEDSRQDEWHMKGGDVSANNDAAFRSLEPCGWKRQIWFAKAPLVAASYFASPSPSHYWMKCCSKEYSLLPPAKFIISLFLDFVLCVILSGQYGERSRSVSAAPSVMSFPFAHAPSHSRWLANSGPLCGLFCFRCIKTSFSFSFESLRGAMSEEWDQRWGWDGLPASSPQARSIGLSIALLSSKRLWRYPYVQGMVENCPGQLGPFL